MSKRRLDQVLTAQGLVQSRSQAENLIKLGQVTVDGRAVTKPGYFVSDSAKVAVTTEDRYVSRAALKLASIADEFKLSFKGKTILDVGSSTGGFTDYALQHGAKKAIAVEVGTDQLHPSLRGHEKIELHEQTDIRDLQELSSQPDIVVIDVSFISLREILPHLISITGKNTQIIAMVKPQFEAAGDVKHKGVIKNERVRRDILKDFEEWAKTRFVVQDKADSKVAGTKGNLERFYLLSNIA
jgi:23S rRNA (cytidine1920-2'-O)/16S rRNA (cytidine1409-2'-O)-methyltransferase